MRILKVSLCVLFLLLIAVYAYSGGKGEQEAKVGKGPVDIRFTVWSSFGPHLELLNEIADSYTAQHPNVTIKYDSIIFGDYTTKLTLQLSGSDPPDGGWILERTAPMFIDAGVMANLKDHLLKKEDYNYEDFSKPATKLWVTEDGIYGVPFSTSPFITYYNEDLFRAAGVPTPKEEAKKGNWTWDTLRASGKKIKEATGVWSYQNKDGKGFSLTPYVNLEFFLKGYGTTPWDEEGKKCLLSTPEAIAAAKMYHSMIFEDRAAVPPGDESNYFAGAAATTISQISHAKKLKDAAFKWDIAPLPAGPAGKVYLIGQAAIVAFENSRKRSTVIDFISHMTNEENVKKMTVFFPPARKKVLDSPDFLNSNPLISAESMKVVAEAAKKGTILSAHVNFPKIRLITQGLFDKLWVPGADVEAVLKETCEKISPLLNK